MRKSVMYQGLMLSLLSEPETDATLGAGESSEQPESTAPEGIDPTAQAIAEMLDIDLSGTDSAEDASETVVEAVRQIVETLQELAERIDGDDDDEAPEAAPQNQEVAASFSPMLLSMASENRGMKITDLAQRGVITPAVAKDLRRQWCSEQAISLALSSDGEDGFDNLINTLAKNGPVLAFREKSGMQGRFQTLGTGGSLSLSGDEILDEKKNPLLADAASRRN